MEARVRYTSIIAMALVVCLFLNINQPSNVAIATEETSVKATLKFSPIVPVAINIDDVVVSEGDTAKFTVSLEGVTLEPIIIVYTTAEDTDGDNPATTGDDYSPVSGSVTIPAGETSAEVEVPTLDDSVEEPNETFLLNLTDVSGPAYFEDSQGLGTILDDEGSPSIIIDDIIVQEGVPATFTIRLSHSTSETISIEYSTEDDTALEEEDYQEVVTGTVDIPAGETNVTVTVPTIDDLNPEPDEDFFLNLEEIAPAGEAYFADDQGIATILDNDIPEPQVEEEEVGGAAGEVEEDSSCSPVCPPTMPVIRGKKRDKLVSDVDNDGYVDKGDRIEYTVHITRGDLGFEGIDGGDILPVNRVLYIDTVDPGLKVIQESLSSSPGSIKMEDHQGETVILVEATDIQNTSWPITIRFTAEVIADLSSRRGPISGQGIIYTDSTPTRLTDDPSTNLLSDATLTGFDFNKEFAYPKVRESVNIDKTVQLLGKSEKVAKLDGPISSEVSKRVGGPDRMVEYTIFIKNKSEKPVGTSKLIEPLDSHVDYVKNSLTINNKKVVASDISPTSNILAFRISKLLPGERVRIKFRGVIKSPLGQNKGYLGTRSILSTPDWGLVFSDDPETKRYGDPTVVMLRGSCDISNVSQLWDLWLSYVSESSPDIVPVMVSSSSGLSSRNRAGKAGEAAEEKDEERDEKVSSSINWVLYGKSRKNETLEELDVRDTIKASRPDFAFSGAAKFSLDKGTIGKNAEIIFKSLGKKKLAGGSGKVSSGNVNLYLQGTPNCPIYKNVFGLSSQYGLKWKIGGISRGPCLGDFFVPMIKSIGGEREKTARNIDNSFGLFLINQENSS